MNSRFNALLIAGLFVCQVSLSVSASGFGDFVKNMANVPKDLDQNMENMQKFGNDMHKNVENLFNGGIDGKMNLNLGNQFNAMTAQFSAKAKEAYAKDLRGASDGELRVAAAMKLPFAWMDEAVQEEIDRR
eukprot:324167_1